MKHLLPLLVASSIGCIDEIQVGSRTTFFGGDPPQEWESFETPVDDLLYGIAGVSSSAIWAVGERGVILRFDGNRWEREQSPTADDLLAVYAASSDDVWAVGDGGTIVRFDGIRWSQVNAAPIEIGGDPARLVDVSGSSQTDVWALPEGTLDLGGDYDPGAIHFDGASWSLYRRPETDGRERALAVSGNSTWALTGACVQRFGGTTWIDVGSPTSDTLFSMEDAWADEGGRLWVLGYDLGGSRARIFRYDGIWTELDGEGIAQESLHLFSIAGAGEEVLAVGDGSHLARFDGTSWHTAIETSFTHPNLLAVTIIEDRIWAVGARGTIVRAQ